MKKIDVVCAIIINDKDEVFCCQRGSGRSLEGKWEFPGGKVEEGEFGDEALKREIKEELNSVIKVGLYRGTFDHLYPEMDGKMISMKAYDCELVSGNLELREHTDSKWLKPHELDTVEWAEADRPIVEVIKKALQKQKYTICMANPDETDELIWSDICSEITMQRKFSEVINKQAEVYHSEENRNNGYSIKWRQIRVYNSANELIATES